MMRVRLRWITLPGRLRFSIQAILILVTFACTFAGWVAYHRNWIHDRHRFADNHWPPLTMSAEPPWILMLFGEKPRPRVHLCGT